MNRVIRIHALAPRKPAAGDPCNGCGVCCAVAPCPVGMVVSLRTHGACSALVWSSQTRRYRCGMVDEPLHALAPWMAWLHRMIRRLMMRWISAGSGCDCHWEAQAAHVESVAARH